MGCCQSQRKPIPVTQDSKIIATKNVVAKQYFTEDMMAPKELHNGA